MYDCEICDKEFTSNKKLLSHLERCEKRTRGSVSEYRSEERSMSIQSLHDEKVTLVDKLNSLEKINASLASTLKDEGKSKSVIESELDAMKSENERLLSLVKEQSEEKEELEKLESENTELRQQLEMNE